MLIYWPVMHLPLNIPPPDKERPSAEREDAPTVLQAHSPPSFPVIRAATACLQWRRMITRLGRLENSFPLPPAQPICLLSCASTHEDLIRTDKIEPPSPRFSLRFVIRRTCTPSSFIFPHSSLPSYLNGRKPLPLNLWGGDGPFLSSFRVPPLVLPLPHLLTFEALKVLPSLVLKRGVRLELFWMIFFLRDRFRFPTSSLS